LVPLPARRAARPVSDPPDPDEHGEAWGAVIVFAFIIAALVVLALLERRPA
jgi:hypothetical protein